MSPLVILVEFELAPGARAAFVDLIRANAQASLRDEPGCRQFDVLHDPATPDRIVLYEIYDDDAAFDAHLQAPHYAAFRAASNGMVRAQSVRRLRPA